MDAIAGALETVSLGGPAGHENLWVFPLMGGTGTPPDYLTLDEALEGGHARVTEVSEDGSVPELRFVNESEHRILLLDGEELVGAKQNRTLNVSIMAGAKQTVVVPVTCVEQGRWSYRSPEFRAARHAHFARARAAKAAQVSESLRSRGSREADQGQVWEEISSRARRLRAVSPTLAMDEIYEKHRRRVESYQQALPTAEGQVGAVFAIGRQVAGLDLFDSAVTLRKLWPKIVSSYAVDAIDRFEEEDERTEAPAEAVGAFLQAVTRAPVERFPALGLGEDLRVVAPRLAGGALHVGGRVVHMAVFSREPAGNGESRGTRRARMARASRRRRG